MGRKSILSFVIAMLACGFLLMPVASYSEDGSSGKWDKKQEQIYELNAYQIKPPQGVGSNYTLKIGQSGKTTELLGNITKKLYVDTETASATTLTSADSGKVYYQYTSTPQTFNLPADPTGCDFTFVKDSSSAILIIDPNSTDQIVNTNAAAGDYYCSTSAYGSIRLVGINATTWIAITPFGTWRDQ